MKGSELRCLLLFTLLLLEVASTKLMPKFICNYLPDFRKLFQGKFQ